MSSSDNTRTFIAKLKGSDNYEVWSLRTTAYLIKEGTYKAISDPKEVDDDTDEKALSSILLVIEDGPLLQIQYIKTALEAWNSLKNLYTLEGFYLNLLYVESFSILL